MSQCLIFNITYVPISFCLQHKSGLFTFTQNLEKMRIDILTVVPELLESPLNHSIIQRAKDKGIVEIYIHNIRDFSEDKHKRVDDYAFSGGAGMVMRLEPIVKAIEHLTNQRDYDEIIFTTPDGPKFNQKTANTLSLKKNLIILCGHYKGIDQRIRDHFITKEISIGDYVLTGENLLLQSLPTALFGFCLVP